MTIRKKRKRYKEKSKIKVIKGEFRLTNQDQVTYIYKLEKDEYVEVTNVSYEIEIENTWMTIVRFDSAHGYLHQHVRVSLNDEGELLDKEVKQGSPHDWLTFAMDDIRTNYLNYKKKFFERSTIIGI